MIDDHSQVNRIYNDQCHRLYDYKHPKGLIHVLFDPECKSTQYLNKHGQNHPQHTKYYEHPCQPDQFFTFPLYDKLEKKIT